MIRYIQQAWLVLLLALVFGVALAGVNAKLKPMIEANEAKAKKDAALELVPGAKYVEIVKMTLPIKDKQTEEIEVFRVIDGDKKLVGWAFPAEGDGYADVIKLIVGVTADAKTITGMKVIYNQETPGLGNKITETSFRAPFAGKLSLAKLIPAKNKAVADLGPNEIQAVTGATISSRAVCDIIRRRLYRQHLADKLAAMSEEE